MNEMTAKNEKAGQTEIKTNQGEKKMNKWMKKPHVVLTGLLLLGMCLTPAQAQTNDPDSAYIIITITPNVDRGVSIDTQNVNLDLGSVDLYGTTQTVRPATVTILGTVSSDGSETTGQELDLTLSFAVPGGVTPWALDITPATHAVLGAQDEIAVYALFSDTTLGAAPTGDDFDADFGEFSASGSPNRAGGTVTNGTHFEKTGTGAVNMDHLSAGDKAHLWMLFRLPNVTTETLAQEITLTATAVNAT